MAKKKPKLLVHLIVDPLEVKKTIPVYFFGIKGYLSKNNNFCLLSVNNISDLTLDKINAFVLNLSSFFKDNFFVLTNSLSANRYLCSLYDTFLKGWQLLEVLKNHSEIYLLIDKGDEIVLWKNFLLSNNVDVITDHQIYATHRIKTFVGEFFGIFKEYFPSGQ